MVNITYVDLLALASSFPFAQQINSIATTAAAADHISFVAYDQSFVTDVLGNNATEELVATLPWAAFHEAGAYNLATNKIYLSSNRGADISNPINITTIDLSSNNAIGSTRYPNIAQANGGRAYYPPSSTYSNSSEQQIIFCDQGDLNDHPAQLTVLDPATNSTKVLLNSFFGKRFLSINDVVQHPLTGDLWFTDARYSFWQGYGLEPEIRSQVYRFSPSTGVIQAVADSFIAPNGIEFSPDFSQIYISDTGSVALSKNATEPATIYRYDVSPSGKTLSNRSLFAYSANGIPDGLHTDTAGNVFAGCGDGVHVWDSEGTPLGKIVVPGAKGTANFAFVPGGVFVFNEERLWKVGIKAEGREVRRDFGL